jgi:hypothetical protein
MPEPACRALIALCIFSAAALLSAQGTTTDQSGNLQARVRELEAREQIRALMHNYGRHLDERNFPAFAALFAETDSEYISGGRTVRGARAISAMLEEIITANPSGFKSPNYHVFFNETIDVVGDRATAFSQSAFIVPGVNGNPEMVFFATYDDLFIRDAGVWKFKRRKVKGPE